MDLNGMFHGKYDHTWGYPGDDRDKLSNTPRNETLIGSMGSIVSIDLGNPCSPVVDIVEATWIWQKIFIVSCLPTFFRSVVWWI